MRSWILMLAFTTNHSNFASVRRVHHYPSSVCNPCCLPFWLFVCVRRQNKTRRQLAFVLNSLTPAGEALVSGRSKLPTIVPPNSEPLGDISKDAVWTALTGNQTWVVSSIAGLLFGPIFSSPQSMVSMPHGVPQRRIFAYIYIFFLQHFHFSGMRCVVFSNCRLPENGLQLAKSASLTAGAEKNA